MLRAVLALAVGSYLPWYVAAGPGFWRPSEAKG